MRFLTLFFKRVAYSLVLVLAVIVLNFLLIHLAPGDPAQTIAGQMGGATEETMAAIRAAYGLDKPVFTQLAIYMGRALRGDLGYSFFFNRPVTDLILQRLMPTVLLVFPALLLSVTAGTFLGVLAAQRPNGLFSHLVTVIALIGYSAPVFWTGLMLLILFASIIPLFPVSGMYNVALSGGLLTRTLDVLHHLVLPMVTLATIYLAVYSRLSRTSMLEVLGSDYIRTARAKGLGQSTVIYRHALKNAILPVLTMAGLQMSYLFSGAVLVETVFAWPGLGRLAFESILRRDYPTVLGLLFFSTFIVVAANFLTDICYGLVDPRIRAGKAK